jgi:hypothetical protein
MNSTTTDSNNAARLFLSGAGNQERATRGFCWHDVHGCAAQLKAVRERTCRTAGATNLDSVHQHWARGTPGTVCAVRHYLKVVLVCFKCVLVSNA